MSETQVTKRRTNRTTGESEIINFTVVDANELPAVNDWWMDGHFEDEFYQLPDGSVRFTGRRTTYVVKELHNYGDDKDYDFFRAVIHMVTERPGYEGGCVEDEFDYDDYYAVPRTVGGAN